ncbi:hypothetical protein J437_LFUL004691, partial [Ladona fulva]
MLDVGLSHEPYCGCHVVLSVAPSGIPVVPSHLLPLHFPSTPFKTQSKDSTSEDKSTSRLPSSFSIPSSTSSTSLAALASISGPQVYVIDQSTMNLITVEVTREILIETFRSTKSAELKMAIIHYFLIHLGDWDAISELLIPLAENPLELWVPKILQEVLVAGAYASAARNLPTDTSHLVTLLPLTTMVDVVEVEVLHGNSRACLNEVTLWNACVTLLSPGQRLVPYRADLWTRLWDNAQAGKRRASCDEMTPLSSGILSPSSHSGIVCDSGPQTGARGSWRFRPSLVADKLMVSLVCYQPEALSRSSTPLSPGGAILSTNTADLSSLTASRKSSGAEGSLPFHEAESCTASKQEHVISV